MKIITVEKKALRIDECIDGLVSLYQWEYQPVARVLFSQHQESMETFEQYLVRPARVAHAIGREAFENKFKLGNHISTQIAVTDMTLHAFYLALNMKLADDLYHKKEPDLRSEEIKPYADAMVPGTNIKMMNLSRTQDRKDAVQVYQHSGMYFDRVLSNILDDNNGGKHLLKLGVKKWKEKGIQIMSL